MAQLLSLSAILSLDTTGADKMLANLAPDKRAKVAREAFAIGAAVVRNVIRGHYSQAKPGSDKAQAIVMHTYPKGTGAVVRRYYSRRATGTAIQDKAYILSILEVGAAEGGTVPRNTKGKSKKGGKYAKRFLDHEMNRGILLPLRFFRRGRRVARPIASAAIARKLQKELTQLARK